MNNISLEQLEVLLKTNLVSSFPDIEFNFVRNDVQIIVYVDDYDFIHSSVFADYLNAFMLNFNIDFIKDDLVIFVYLEEFKGE